MRSVTRSPILRIVLTGFMGAGKSTLGPLVAEGLGWRFIDVDAVLVESEGRSIAELFEQAGETRFRAIEEEAISRLLTLEQTVLALGGGALESDSTRARLLGSPGTHVVFLETPLETALARCAQQAGGAVRPVLLDQTALAGRFARRLAHYRQAHQTLNTAHGTPGELARLLLDSLEPHLKSSGDRSGDPGETARAGNSPDS